MIKKADKICARKERKEKEREEENGLVLSFDRIFWGRSDQRVDLIA